jgi:vesicle-fusing ATPase
LSNGQILVSEFQGSPAVRITVTHLAPIDFGLDERSSRALRSGVITSQTEIKVSKTTVPLVAADVSSHQNAILRSDFSFQELGIGGLDREFEVIFRRAFASRLFPAPLIERMGIQHVRGLLLFGPPGTGKTLIARQIGKTLNAREPKIVNGPELLNKYVGQSEENVRKIFEDAEKEYKEKGDASQLHIIIFDELDAVCKQRGSGSSGGTGVGDNIVNQLLTKLDGVDQLNNLLLIGMTNRKDLIDEALLRPGRLEIHLEISLPDEPGRLQIFKIHTAKLSDNGLLGKDVSLTDLSARTRNYSGAEISGLVRLASSFAFARHTEMRDGKGPKIDDVEGLEVVKQDFEMGLAETTPMFGTAEEDLMTYLEGGIFDYSPEVNKILKNGIRLASIMQESRFTRLSTLLLSGPPGSGKTALAAAIARDSGIPFIKVIKRGDLAGLSDLQKIQSMQRVFMDADKTPQSIVLIDDIEKIFEYVDSAPPRFIGSVLSALGAFMSIKPPKQRRRLIIATTSSRFVLGQLGLLEAFESEIPVPNIENIDDIGAVLRETGDLQAWQVDQILGNLRDNPGQKRISIGVKRVVTAAQVSRQDKAEEVPYIVADRIRQMMVPIHVTAVDEELLH